VENLLIINQSGNTVNTAMGKCVPCNNENRKFYSSGK